MNSTEQDEEGMSVNLDSYVHIGSPSSTVNSVDPSFLNIKPVKYVMNNSSFLFGKLPNGQVCVLTEEEMEKIEESSQKDCEFEHVPLLEESAECIEVKPEELLTSNFELKEENAKLKQRIEELESLTGDNEKDNTDLRKMVDSLKSEVKAKKESVEVLKTVCEKLCMEKEELEQTIKNACQTVQSLDNQLEQETFAKFKAEGDFVKLRSTTTSLLDELKKMQESLAQKEAEKESLKCSYDSELDKASKDKEGMEVELQRSRTDSELLQGELARALGRARDFEGKWRNAEAKAKGFRRQLDANYAKVLHLEEDNRGLRENMQQGVDAQERVKELESILKAFQ
jgi:chromosome segregation ATPase